MPPAAHLENVSAKDIHLNVQQSYISTRNLVALGAVLLISSIIGYKLLTPERNITQIVKGGTAISNENGNTNIVIGKSVDEYGKIKEELGVTKNTIDTFLLIIQEKQIEPSKRIDTLKEMVRRYKELLILVDSLKSDDPEIKRLLDLAKVALEQANFGEAEKLYNQASEKDLTAVNALNGEEERLQKELHELKEKQSHLTK